MKIYVSVEWQNGQQFVVWRTESGFALASYCNEKRGIYIVGTLRILRNPFRKRMGGCAMDIITDFCGVENSMKEMQKDLILEHGECEFVNTKSFEEWKHSA